MSERLTEQHRCFRARLGRVEKASVYLGAPTLEQQDNGASSVQKHPRDPKKADRDRFVLSKGHTAPALYAALAERGYFPREDLKTFRHIDSYLQGHPDMKGTPGVDMTTGSLGLGFSAACGMALSAKISGESYRVYSVLGDGESEEGQVWEAAMFAAHKKLDNLCIFLDYNGLQIDGPISEVNDPSPLDISI